MSFKEGVQVSGLPQQMNYSILHDFPPPEVEKAWRDGLSRVDCPSHYNGPEFFLDPLYRGTQRFAILALNKQAAVGVLTGAHFGDEVVCGLPTRPQVCFSKSVDPTAAGEALTQGLLEEAGRATVLAVYSWSTTPLQAFERRGFRLRKFQGDVVLDLTKGPGAVFQQLDKKRRTSLRQATKTNLSVFQASSREDVLAYYEIQARWKQTSRKVIHYPTFSVDQFEQRYRLRENIRLFLARHEGKIIAGATIRFFPGGLLEYANNASLDEFLHLRPNDLLVWKVIEWACAEGFPRFSLGGAHLFLRKFGGTVIPIHRYRLDRTSLRQHDLREALKDAARGGLRRLPAPVSKTIRRLMGKD